MPSVSVVIPSRGRAAQLATVLAPLIADAGVAEIVVVVDGQDAESHRVLAAMAETEPRLTALPGPGRGAGAARAVGVDATTGDIVLLLDDDVVAGPALASRHAACHGSTASLVVIGALEPHLPRSAPDRLYAEAYRRWWASVQADPTTALPRLWMGNVSLRRSDAVRVGLDEPRMDGRRHEDRELGIRLAHAGLEARIVPELAARHDHHRTAEAFAADCRAEGAGRRALHDLHGIAAPPRVPLATAIARAARPLAGRSLLAARILRRAAIAAGAAT